MVVQTHALARGRSVAEQVPLVRPGRSRAIVASVVLAETAWLLGLAWGLYAVVF
jgi:hypothetical protein